MSIEDYNFVDDVNNSIIQEEVETDNGFSVVYVQNLGQDIDGKYIYHFYLSNIPDEVFAEGWGEVPACNVPRELMSISEDMYQHIVEAKTDIKLDLAQDSCCFSMQDSRDNIVALGWENLDTAEVYPEPRIIIHYGDDIKNLEKMLATRDVPTFYVG